MSISNETLEEWSSFVSNIRYNVLSDIAKCKNITKEDISDFSISVAKLEEVFERIVNKIVVEKAPETREQTINDLKNRIRDLEELVKQKNSYETFRKF
jgi:predicted DNA-binding protein YlxM (UPF0122 family)